MTTMRRSALALGTLVLLAGPAHAADTALLIGNSNYENKCAVDVTGVPMDVDAMSGHLMNYGYQIVSTADRSGIEMLSDIEGNVPPAGDDYVVYYDGHGEIPVNGSLLGIDCTRTTAADIVLAVDIASDRTLLILDSEASGALGDAVNALDPNFCVITSATGLDAGTRGVFTPCFAAGLEGAADADNNNMVTVAEAAAYAIANCGDGTTTPTWDGGCPDRVLSVGSIAVDATSWGRVKGDYR
ncbi:MAG: caspase family protein [Gemmatimonadetes bacterium]|nr:caspase family protein [Gemmatimonadota bacterium]